MDTALVWAVGAIALAWKVLSSPVTSAIVLLLILAKLQEQNATLLGIYRRLHLRARREEAADDADDDEADYDEPGVPPLDELVKEEIEMQAGRLPRREGIVRRTMRRIRVAFGRND